MPDPWLSNAAFTYFLLPRGYLPHMPQPSIREQFPLGIVLSARVRRQISQYSRSITLLVRMRIQYLLGKSQ